MKSSRLKTKSIAPSVEFSFKQTVEPSLKIMQTSSESAEKTEKSMT
jgi:hypothetical protein